MTVALIASHTSYGSNFTFEAMATLYDSVQVGNETEVHFIANLFWKLGLAVMGFGKGTGPITRRPKDIFYAFQTISPSCSSLQVFYSFFT